MAKMPGEPQGILEERDKLGRYKPGFNPRITRRMRIAAKLEELRHEFFPSGGESRMDASRLRLAAQHYYIAETARDPTVSVRSTRTAEYLLNKLKPAVLRPAQVSLETARELLDRLTEGDPPVAR